MVVDIPGPNLPQRPRQLACRAGSWLEVGQPSDDEAGEGGDAGIIGEELIAARELCGGSMNGIRQLEPCFRAQTSGRKQDVAANRRHVQ